MMAYSAIKAIKYQRTKNIYKGKDKDVVPLVLRK